VQRGNLRDQSLDELVHDLKAVDRHMDLLSDGSAHQSYVWLSGEAKRIGEELNRRGGCDLMVRAAKMANASNHIELAWDGIGGWMA
jgi:hypothetical protein